MSYKVQQCRQCKRLFQSYGANVCPECADKIDKDFISVKDFLYDNPNANVIEIIEETGVSEKTVLSFLREGRLSVSSNNGILECSECGAPISTGRYCSSCMSRLENALRGASKSVLPKKDKENNFSSGGAHTGGIHSDYNKRNF